MILMGISRIPIYNQEVQSIAKNGTHPVIPTSKRFEHKWATEVLRHRELF